MFDTGWEFFAFFFFALPQRNGHEGFEWHLHVMSQTPKKRGISSVWHFFVSVSVRCKIRDQVQRREAKSMQSD